MRIFTLLCYLGSLAAVCRWCYSLQQHQKRLFEAEQALMNSNNAIVDTVNRLDIDVDNLKAELRKRGNG